MATEYISKTDAIHVARYAARTGKDVSGYIEHLPAAEVAPVVHGEWIERPYLLGTSRFCSVCGENYGMPHGIYNYCPNCGANMEG